MPQNTALKPTPLHICRLRVTTVNADGTVAPGPNNSYVTALVNHLNYAPVLSQGDSKEMRSGCDCIVASYDAPDILKSYTLELERPALDPAIESMLLGFPLLVDNSTEPVPIGLQFISGRDCGETPAYTTIEAWTDNWRKGGLALAPFRYTHWLFHRVAWAPANGSLQNDFSAQTLNGKTSDNPAWGLGPYGDIPPGADTLGGFGDTAGYVYTNVLPAATDAFATASSG